MKVDPLNWTTRATGASRHLVEGDEVLCDWELTGRITRHKIIGARRHVAYSGSGIQFQVDPPLPMRINPEEDWIDSDWFIPAKVERLLPYIAEFHGREGDVE